MATFAVIFAGFVCSLLAFMAGKKWADKKPQPRVQQEPEKPEIDQAVMEGVIERMARLHEAKEQHEALQQEIRKVIERSVHLRDKIDEGIKTLQVLLDSEQKPEPPAAHAAPAPAAAPAEVKVVEVVNDSHAEGLPVAVYDEPFEDVEDTPVEEVETFQPDSPVLAIAMPKNRYWEIYNKLKSEVPDYKQRWFLQAGQINGSSGQEVFLAWDRRAFNAAPCQAIRDFLTKRYADQIEAVKVQQFSRLNKNGQLDNGWQTESLPSDVAFSSAGSLVLFWGDTRTKERFFNWSTEAAQAIERGVTDTTHLFPRSKEEYMRRRETRHYRS